MVDIFNTTRQFLRVDEVAELLGVTRRTIYYWIEDGQVQAVHISGTYRIPTEHIRKRLPQTALSQNQ